MTRAHWWRAAGDVEGDPTAWLGVRQRTVSKSALLDARGSIRQTMGDANAGTRDERTRRVKHEGGKRHPPFIPARYGERLTDVQCDGSASDRADGWTPTRCTNWK